MKTGLFRADGRDGDLPKRPVGAPHGAEDLDTLGYAPARGKKQEKNDWADQFLPVIPLLNQNEVEEDGSTGQCDIEMDFFPLPNYSGPLCDHDLIPSAAGKAKPSG
jgi:hypothetical protein